jgi:serine/threonine-protein kinase
LSSAQAAVRYAPSRSNAQSALGVVLQNFNDFQGANRAFERALQLGADSETLRRIALFRARIGAAASALQLVRRAHELDPLNSSITGDVGIVQFYGRNYQGAIGTLSAYLRDRGNSSRHRDYLLRSLALAGRTSEAEAELTKISTDWLRLVDAALIAARSGDRARADQALTRVIGINANQLAFQLAQIHAQRGEKDQAIADLRNAVKVHDAGLQALPTDPFLDPLRADPRFAELLNELKFPRA